MSLYELPMQWVLTNTVSNNRLADMLTCETRATLSTPTCTFSDDVSLGIWKINKFYWHNIFVFCGKTRCWPTCTVLLNDRKDKADLFTTAIKIINNDWNKIMETTRNGSCFSYLLPFKVCDLRSKTKTVSVALAKQLRSVTVIFFMSVRLAGFPHGKGLLSRDRFLCNFVFVIFTKTCPHAQTLLLMWQKLHVVYTKNYGCHI